MIMHWNREDGRHYSAFICQDLLRDWVVVKSWGGKGRRFVQQEVVSCCSKEAALDFLADLAKRRHSRGYKLTAIDIYAPESAP